MSCVANIKTHMLQNITMKSLCVEMKELARWIVAFFFTQADVMEPVMAAPVLLAKAADTRSEGQVCRASSRHSPIFAHNYHSTCKEVRVVITQII